VYKRQAKSWVFFYKRANDLHGSRFTGFLYLKAEFAQSILTKAKLTKSI